MDITVERNAFGRQVDSFEADLDVPVLQQVDPDPRPYHAVFIRAPLISTVMGVSPGAGAACRMAASWPPSRDACWPPLFILN